MKPKIKIGEVIADNIAASVLAYPAGMLRKGQEVNAYNREGEFEAIITDMDSTGRVYVQVDLD